MKTPLLLLVTVFCAAACLSPMGPAQGQGKFVALGGLAASAVGCVVLQENELADGRLTVRAQLVNRTSQRIQVQVNCVFKDAQGFSTGDETPFEPLFLDEGAQQTVPFTSLNNKAKTYTVQVRLQR